MKLLTHWLLNIAFFRIGVYPFICLSKDCPFCPEWSTKALLLPDGIVKWPSKPGMGLFVVRGIAHKINNFLAYDSLHPGQIGCCQPSQMFTAGSWRVKLPTLKKTKKKVSLAVWNYGLNFLLETIGVAMAKATGLAHWIPESQEPDHLVIYNIPYLNLCLKQAKRCETRKINPMSKKLLIYTLPRRSQSSRCKHTETFSKLVIGIQTPDAKHAAQFQNSFC